MTYRPKADRDAAAVDRAVEGGDVEQRIAAIQARLAARPRHGTSCRCLDCIGSGAYTSETVCKRAENDERGYPSPPRKPWREMRRTI